MMRLDPGVAWDGPLCAWGIEADLLRKYYRNAEDVFSVVVRDCVALRNPVWATKRHTKWRVERGDLLWSSSRPQHDFWFPWGLDGCRDDWELVGGGCVRDVLRMWEADPHVQIPCFGVVQPLSELVAAKAWRTLLMRRSWRIARAAFPPSCWKSLTTDAHQYSKPVVLDRLGSQDFRELAERLKAWAPLIYSGILQSHGEAEALTERLQVVDDVVFLEGVAEALTPGGTAVENANGGRLYDTLALLQSLRLSRLLKNASKLKAVVDQGITAVFLIIGGDCAATTMAVCQASAAKRIHTAHQPLPSGHCSLSVCAAATGGLCTDRYSGRITAAFSGLVVVIGNQGEEGRLVQRRSGFLFPY